MTPIGEPPAWKRRLLRVADSVHGISVLARAFPAKGPWDRHATGAAAIVFACLYIGLPLLVFGWRYVDPLVTIVAVPSVSWLLARLTTVVRNRQHGYRTYPPARYFPPSAARLMGWVTAGSVSMYVLAAVSFTATNVLAAIGATTLVGLLFEVVAAFRNRAMNLLAPIDPRALVETGKAPIRR